jgi:tetratricopeptide (TPR) repeat protein
MMKKRTRPCQVRRLFGRFLAALLVGVATTPDVVRGQSHQHGDALGKVEFPVSCSEHAQIEFGHAVALLHHMTYPEAREAFEEIAKSDPRCAMAQWGISMTLFQPLWPTRPGPQALQRGWEASQKAQTLQPPTERERLFIAATAAFFEEPASKDYWARIRRWEAAMQKVHAAYPDDPEAAAFYALAHLAVAPPDATATRHSERAAAILLRVFERNPDHPGAMHYLVHANDAPGRERESLEITRKYESAAPRNPHALHMPTHIYARIGDWDAVIRGNLRAAAAALEHPAGDHREFVWDEFPHAIEYLVYAYLQQGADDKAAMELQRLWATRDLEPTFKTAFHLASTQARFALERRAWNEAARIVPRAAEGVDWDRFAWPEAISQFARGLGAAQTGNASEAENAVARLAVLEEGARVAGEDLFARNIRVLHLELGAWIAHVQGKHDASMALMEQAVEIEASTPKHAVTPAPTLPARELMGDLLTEVEQHGAALASYSKSLESNPRRFNSLLGGARAARSLGNQPLAREFYRRLLDVAGGGTRGPALAEARAYSAQ